jgi:hypothetical protein
LLKCFADVLFLLLFWRTLENNLNAPQSVLLHFDKPDDEFDGWSDSFLFVGMNFATISCNESLDIKLAFASLIIHVANFPEDISLSPTLIMNATNRPHTA